MSTDKVIGFIRPHVLCIMSLLGHPVNHRWDLTAALEADTPSRPLSSEEGYSAPHLWDKRPLRPFNLQA